MYVLREKNEGAYIALDSASGGYPYTVDLAGAHCFKTLQEAERYNAVMSSKDYDNPVYDVEELFLTTQPVQSAKGEELASIRL